MTDADRILAKFLRRLNIGNFLARLGEWLAVVLFMLGVSVLVVRLLVPGLWPEVLWLSLGAIPVGYLAWRISRKQNFSRRESVALFDSKLQAGGLLMTMTERPIESWDEYFPQRKEELNSSLPKIRPFRFLKVISIPLLFLVGVCLIPLQSHSGEGRERGNIQQKTTQKLQQMLDELKEAQLLNPEEAEKFQQEIGKLKEQNADSPMTHERWETADTIEARLKRQAEEAVRTMQQAQQALDKLNKENRQNQSGAKQKGKTVPQKQSSGAKKQKKGSRNRNKGQKLTDEQRRQLIENITKALKMMLENNSELLSKLSPEMLEKIKEMMKQQKQLEIPEDAELRRQLMEELQNLMQSESERLQELMQKLRESGQLKELQEMLGQCQNPGEAQSNKENPSSQSNSEQPGEKGVNRGPGTSPIDGTHQPTKKKIGFRDVILPPGFHDKTKKVVVRTEVKDPEIEADGRTVRGNRKFEKGSSDLESFKRRIRPKHRRTVRKYFESKKKK